MSQRDVWLTLREGVSVLIPLAEALTMDRKGFAKVYRSTICGAKRREALEWADRQIAFRAAATGITE